MDDYFEEQEEQTPVCPICGRECDYVYYDRDGEIIGCDCCIERKDAFECEECFTDPFKEKEWP